MLSMWKYFHCSEFCATTKTNEMHIKIKLITFKEIFKFLFDAQSKMLRNSIRLTIWNFANKLSEMNLQIAQNLKQIGRRVKEVFLCLWNSIVRTWFLSIFHFFLMYCKNPEFVSLKIETHFFLCLRASLHYTELFHGNKWYANVCTIYFSQIESAESALRFTRVLPSNTTTTKGNFLVT